jgi:hypothetical protein
MRAYTVDELNILGQNRKTPKPILNLPAPAGASPISQNVEDWLILMPNPVKQLFVWTIDYIVNNHAGTSVIEARLMRELADNQNIICKQKLWVLDNQVGSISYLYGLAQNGISVTGTAGLTAPDEVIPVMNLIRYPVKESLGERDSLDYEYRLNNYICSMVANTNFLDYDKKVLLAWKQVISDYTTGSLSAAPSTIANMSAGGAAAIASSPLFFSMTPDPNGLAWGTKFPKPAEYPAFKARMIQICGSLGINPDWLMAVMWAESNLRADIVNPKGGATGLIQFMPSTAIGLGTTTGALRVMTATQQLDYVYKYFQSFAGKMHSVGDVYAVIFMPIALGKDSNTTLGQKGNYSYLSGKLTYNAVYEGNPGLDLNRDGIITAAELTSRATTSLTIGSRNRA